MVDFGVVASIALVAAVNVVAEYTAAAVEKTGIVQEQSSFVVHTRSIDYIVSVVWSLYDLPSHYSDCELDQS